MISLGLASLAGLILEHFEKLSHRQAQQLAWFEVFVGTVFLAEFCLEWYHSRVRRHYFRQNWMFLIAAVPVPAVEFDVLHVVRLLRIFRLVKIYEHLRFEYDDVEAVAKKKKKRRK